MKRLNHAYKKICNFISLLNAAHRAAKGKKKTKEIMDFFYHLEANIILLEKELCERSYQPRAYKCFYIYDTKPRFISAPHFRDRVVHHAICNVLGPWLEKSFIYHTYASRKGKGTHRAIKQAMRFSRSFSYYLKCDVKSFFDSVDRRLLKDILLSYIK